MLKKSRKTAILRQDDRSWIQTVRQHDVNLMDKQTSAQGLEPQKSTFVRAWEKVVTPRKVG